MDGVPPANLVGEWKSGHIVAATPFCPGQGWTYSVFPELRRAELAPSGSHAINCENIWGSRGVKAERKRRCRIEDWGGVFQPCQGEGVSASARRAEESRVGKEGVGTGRDRWTRYSEKKKYNRQERTSITQYKKEG